MRWHPLGNKLNSPGDPRGWRTKFLDSVLLELVFAWLELEAPLKVEDKEYREAKAA